MKRIHARVTGRVQGVFYRASTRDKARSLGLTGWVMNMPDGSVELEAQGPDERVEELVSWLYEGPPYAKVQDVEISELSLSDQEDSFEVRYLS